MATFEDSVDIRRLVDQQYYLNLLVSTLLTREQRFLFLHQKAKATSERMEKPS